MPLVPEPFDSVSISRQGLISSLLRGSNSSDTSNHFLAKSFCNFLPNLNIREYREQLTEDEQNDLDQRAQTLEKHSAQSYFDEVSESTWEADVRNDVFGKVRDDSRLRMLVQPSLDYDLQTYIPTVISGLTNSKSGMKTDTMSR